jgi:hypothetical protein
MIYLCSCRRSTRGNRSADISGYEATSEEIPQKPDVDPVAVVGVVVVVPGEMRNQLRGY